MPNIGPRELLLFIYVYKHVVLLGRPCLIVFVSLSLVPLVILCLFGTVKEIIVADTAIGFGL